MRRGKLPLIIAVILGGLASLLVWVQLDKWKNEARQGWELKPVIVAAETLQPGTFISNELLRHEQMPSRFIYDGVLQPRDLDFAIGREVLFPIKANEPIHWYQLQGQRAAQRLSKAIPKNRRAVSISVSEKTAVGGWIQPNDHVDVLGTFRNPASNQMVAVSLLRNVVVLATGKNRTATPTSREQSYGTVTLLVLPQEAEMLILAQQLGSVYLTLRNREDISVFDDKAQTDIKTLLTGERAITLAKRRWEGLKTIKVIRGLLSNPKSKFTPRQ